MALHSPNFGTKVPSVLMGSLRIETTSSIPSSIQCGQEATQAPLVDSKSQEEAGYTEMEVDFAALSNLLWRERGLLESLLFKLDEQHLLFVAGRSEWMARANDEIEVALRHIGASELRRAMAFDDAAQALDVPLNPSLREFAALSPEPWGSLFLEHLLAFTTLAGRIQALSDMNRELATAAQQATDSILASIHGSAGGSSTTYARSGRTEATLRQSAFLDEEI